jgi:exodeoxyribonuclease-5
MRGYGETPELGDRIISLSNHWDDMSDNQDWALTNGCIGILTKYDVQRKWIPRYISSSPIDVMYADFKLDDGDGFSNIAIDYQQFLTGKPSLDGKQAYKLKKAKEAINPPYDFAYAYAITCWKAQGSEWDKVLLFEEEFPYEKLEHQQYLYTGITRASQKLTLILK